MQTPKFFYFDIGNVLLFFDHRQACRQIGQLVDLDEETIWQILFASGLELRYEAGEFTTEEFYEQICEAFGKRVPLAELAHAGSAIFRINAPVHAIAAHLARAGHRLGLLSNTSELHWNYFTDGRYGLIPGTFEVRVASFQVEAIKPDPKIYQIAAQMCGCQPEEIFFVDDVPGHVAGALSVGLDAVQYTSPSALVDDLRARGVQINF